jgi:predicted ATP-dependent endonuclease of OLD family
MYISSFKIVNFKLFQNIKIDFDQSISIITGVNNAGKTTVLQALALWHECFTTLIRRAGTTRANYKKNDYILGNTQEKYFSFNQINSVLSPNFEDIFYQRDVKNKIQLSAIVSTEEQEIEICFQIGSSGQNYVIELINFRDFNFDRFNSFFTKLPSPFGFFYTSPSAVIQQREKFVTHPQVVESIINRDSASVIRNRLYILYRASNSSLWSDFLEKLSFILYNNDQQIIISTSSDIQKHSTVIFTFKHNEADTEKDISLLGSGTIQIIEILLNYYNLGTKDLNLIILDEPDSHIHRDIQNRLLKALTSFPSGNQIFLTTHNEALIRSADLSQLFHLDGNPTGHYQSLINTNLTDVSSHFSGLYPSQINPIIRALGGDINGLDFLNALEADKLILVEGSDDARAFNILLKKRIVLGNIHKKYVYWVLGGISKVFERLPHYKTIFSAIKNQQSLWEKSVLIIDRDFLNDEHQAGLAGQFQTRMNLKANVWSSYTFESTLFTDIPKLSKLLNKWLTKKQINSDLATIQSNLQDFYNNQELQNRYNDDKYREIIFTYLNYKKKLNSLFANNYISQHDVDLSFIIKNHIESCITSEEFFKLMTKDDVMQVIYSTLESYGTDLKPDFIELIEFVDGSTWFETWNFLNLI